LILDPERVAQDAVRAITHGTRAGPSVAAIAAAVKQSLRGRSAAPQKTV
jgi:hypothetical protein